MFPSLASLFLSSKMVSQYNASVVGVVGIRVPFFEGSFLVVFLWLGA